MSHSHKEFIKCPKCGNTGEHEFRDVINGEDIDKNIYLQLMDGELFYYICPHCNRKTQVWYPLLYSNHYTNCMVYFVPEKNDNVADINKQSFKFGSRNRIVRTPLDLTEKLVIFKQGLDDGIVELLKLGIVADRYNESMSQISTINFYERTDHGLLFHIYFSDNRPVEKLYIPYYEYRKYKNTEKINIPTDKFVEVSPFTIMNYVEPKDNGVTNNEENDDESGDLKSFICESVKLSNPDDELHFSKLFVDESGIYEHFMFHKKESIKIDEEKYYIILCMTDDQSHFEILRFSGEELKDLFDKARNKDGTLDKFIKIYFKNKRAFFETGIDEPIEITDHRFNVLLAFRKYHQNSENNPGKYVRIRLKDRRRF